MPSTRSRTAESASSSSRALSDAYAASASSSSSSSSSSGHTAAPQPGPPSPSVSPIDCYAWRGEGGSVQLMSGDQTHWADTTLELQLMDRNPIGVLTGSGFSLVARDSRGAFQFLFEQALLHPELEDDDEDEGEEDDDAASVHSEGGEESMDDAAAAAAGSAEAPLSSAMVERVWSPGARLLAHFPPVLRLPFQLIGTWNSTTGEVNLEKRHGQGKCLWRGVTFFLRPQAADSARVPVDRFHMALQCEFAMADLSFALASTDEAADDVPPPPPPEPESAEGEMNSELEPGAPPPPPPPPMPQPQTQQPGGLA